MKRLLSIILFFALVSCVAMAQRALMIRHADGVTDAVSTAAIDSLEFSDDGSVLKIVGKDGKLVEIRASGISLSYGEMPAEFTVEYNGTTASVVNPFLLEGVTATVAGADVTVNNSNVSTEYSFTLSGETTDGSFIYNGEYKATFVLNGLSITSTKGAAIDIECGKRIAMELKKGTVNTLVDCSGGKQKAALYCKGHLEIDKSGTLNVTGNTKHAISAKEYIQLKKSEGSINILGAVSDGIHCGQYFLSNGYTVSIKNIGGDGIQAELSEDDPYEEDYPDGSVTIQGGTYDIEVTATEASAIKADTDITINSSKMPTSITIKLFFDKIYTLCNTSGEAICTYKFAGNVSNSLGLLTAPNLGKGSITIKTGTEKPTACDVSVNDVFFINPTVTTTATAATVTAK